MGFELWVFSNVLHLEAAGMTVLHLEEVVILVLLESRDCLERGLVVLAAKKFKVIVRHGFNAIF
jgi:hypothetical protein